MKVKGYYSGIVDIEIDGKVQSREFTLNDGDTVPPELEKYLAANFPHLVDKMATSQKDKMIHGVPMDKGVK